ncbi:MAG: HAD superfamily hydrolase (TIGR01509 family) [Motiliproteus sp.]|jgi:HAD superfamily hydrolase (TIGR01509 family)
MRPSPRLYPRPLAVTELLHKGFWIFDLDGTLTLPLHDFAAMRRELGVPVGAGILEHLQQQPETLRTELNNRLIEIEIDVAERAEPMPKAQALIHALFERGTQLAILTRNRRDCVDIVLQRLDLQYCFPPAQIIASECAEPKPSPAGIQRLMSHWQCDQDACVMLGDYLYDLQAGRAAGISTVHVNPHAGPRWPEQTDLELDGFSPLLSALGG